LSPVAYSEMDSEIARKPRSPRSLRKGDVLEELVERMRRMGIEPLGAMERTPSLVEYREWPQRELAPEEEIAVQADGEAGTPG